MTEKTKTMKETKDIYIKEQREVKENYLTQQSLWLSNNTHFCYDKEFPTNKDKENKNTKEAYRQIEEHRKKGRLCCSIHGYHKGEVLPEEASIYTAKMIEIKIILKEKTKNE